MSSYYGKKFAQDISKAKKADPYGFTVNTEKIDPDDYQPKRFGLKYDPPTISKINKKNEKKIFKEEKNIS